MAAACVTALTLSACDKPEWLVKKDDRNNTEYVQEVKPADNNSVAMLLPDFTKLVNEQGATVVSIQAVKQGSMGTYEGTSSEEDPMLEYFRRLIPDFPGAPANPEDDDGASFGSGFIISNDGYILTNTHVVSGTDSIRVVLTDKREFEAKLVGSDTQSDVAVLKIEAKDLPVVKLGKPDELRVGEWVAAIGAPFGFDNTVTAGIVSAKGRSLPNESYTPFIQTDVAINPGNSGGPLFNLKGEVIGINSQIYSRSGGFMGISFAIPIDVATNVADQLKQYGRVRRAQLGVIIQEVSFDLAKSFKLDKPSGALVVKVLPNGPAEKAKLQVRDIILKVNGNVVERSSDLPVLIGAMKPGSKIELTVWRDSKEVKVAVELSELTGESTVTVPNFNQNDGSDTRSRIVVPEVGLSLVALSAEESKQRDIAGGLLVVEAQGFAAASGLMAGDIIISAGPNPLTDEKTFKQALAEASTAAPLFVMRDQDTFFLPLRVK
ncbi:DegQ family serine endoprotease [Vitreoscilla stercoraria]